MSRLFAACLLLISIAFSALAQETRNAHSFTFTAIEGSPLPLASFKGKAVLVVNTASLCGFTPQYDGLQSLYETYGADGLVVLGVPSNDFGFQEPASEGEIKTFCTVNFNVKFPLTRKYAVSGDTAHPFYRWARDRLGADQAPKWNFHKYLIAPDGRLAAAFPSATKPMSATIRTAVEGVLLKAPTSAPAN